MAWRAGTTAGTPEGWRASTSFFGIPFEESTFTFSPQNAGLSKSRSISADVSIFALLPQGAELLQSAPINGWRTSSSFGPDGGWRAGATVVSSAAGSYTISADVNTYTLSSQNNNLVYPRKITANVATYTDTAQSTNLIRNYTLSANHSTFAVSVFDSALLLGPFAIDSVDTDNAFVNEQQDISVFGLGVSTATSLYVINEIYLTSSLPITYVSDTLITFDCPDLVAAGIPFTDINHTTSRVAIANALDYNQKFVTITPSAGLSLFVVTADSANQTAGQSIFAGITIQPNSQVVLPDQIDGWDATWETDINGYATGRLTLGGVLEDPVTVVIDFWDGNINGWDTITVDILDISDSGVAYDIAADVSTHTYQAQSVQLQVTRKIGATYSNFSSTAQNATLRAGRALSAETSEFNYTAIDARLSNVRDLTLPAEQNIITLASQDASIKATRRMTADVAVFTKTNSDADLVADIRMDYVMPADMRQYVFFYPNPSLQYSGANTNPVLRQQQTPEFVESGNIGLPGGPEA